MKKDWVLTQDTFDALLRWLDPDRERAGKKYEAIRERLIKIFSCRGWSEAEDLADETINRVSEKAAELARSFTGDPALFFYGVCQKVHLEHFRAAQKIRAEANPESRNTPVQVFADDIEPEYQCLEKCLEQLPPDSRKLVVEYYQQEKQARIDHHKKMATEFGIAVNALRIRAHRIRLALQRCVKNCLEQLPVN